MKCDKKYFQVHFTGKQKYLREENLYQMRVALIDRLRSLVNKPRDKDVDDDELVTR